MDYKIYNYNKFMVFTVAAGFAAIELGLMYGTVSLLVDRIFVGFGMFSFGLILNALGLIYFNRKFLRPTLKNEPAIELDNETIQYNINNWALSWNEIQSIDSTLYGIKLTQKNGDQVYITLKYISGGYDAVRDTINEYFENCK